MDPAAARPARPATHGQLAPQRSQAAIRRSRRRAVPPLAGAPRHRARARLGIARVGPPVARLLRQTVFGRRAAWSSLLYKVRALAFLSGSIKRELAWENSLSRGALIQLAISPDRSDGCVVLRLDS